MDEERATSPANTRSDESNFEDDEPIVVEPDMSLANIVIVDNVPVAPSKKIEKLRTVLMKIFGQIGTIVDLDLPTDGAQGPTKGFCFIEYSTTREATQAVQQINGYALDKAHIFRVSSMSDMETLKDIPEEFTPPQAADFQPRDDLSSWLLDEKSRDQYFVRYQESTDIMWMEANVDPQIVKGRQHWTETPLQIWSPKGSYLVTYHRLGVALWGGASFERLMRFPHSEVKFATFSPDERYLISFNDQPEDKANDPQALIVWDVRSGVKARGFLKPKIDKMEWPFFKWSSDDKYFAMLGKDVISVYETPSMKLLDKKSVSIPQVQDFQFSPSDPYFACWSPEIGNIPARVTIMKMPERTVVAQKNLFNVKGCKLHWHPQGDFLAVKVDRTTRSKKTVFTSFEFFRIRERDCPVDSFEFKENVIAFAWEPMGRRLAIIHGEGPRASVSFYSMDKKLVLLKKLEKKMANTLFWSPRGGHIVLAGLLNLNGMLEFYDVESLETMGSEEHFMATDVDWDPSGRYVTTFVSYLRHQMENGYKIWSFQGKQIYSESKDRFFQLLWRPRPPTLLSKTKIKKIKQNLKEYTVRYEHEDEEQRDAADIELREEHARLRIEFGDYIREKKDEYERDRKARTALARYETEYDIKEEIEEVVVKEEIEVLDK